MARVRVDCVAAAEASINDAIARVRTAESAEWESDLAAAFRLRLWTARRALVELHVRVAEARAAMTAESVAPGSPHAWGG